MNGHLAVTSRAVSVAAIAVMVLDGASWHASPRLRLPGADWIGPCCAAWATGQWLSEHNNVLVLGKTGTGKSYIACALGNQAARDGH